MKLQDLPEKRELEKESNSVMPDETERSVVDKKISNRCK